MAKKQIVSGPPEPWKGIMPKEDYDSVTKDLSKTVKADFDRDLINRDTDCLMGLRVMGLYNPTKKSGSARGKKNGAKK